MKTNVYDQYLLESLTILVRELYQKYEGYVPELVHDKGSGVKKTKDEFWSDICLFGEKLHSLINDLRYKTATPPSDINF